MLVVTPHTGSTDSSLLRHRQTETQTHTQQRSAVFTENCAHCVIEDRHRHRNSEKQTALVVVTSQTGRDRHSERQLCLLCHSQTETQKHIERDSCARCVIDRQRHRHTGKNCAGCDIRYRQIHIHSEIKTAVLVVTSHTGRDIGMQRKRYLCLL